MSAPQDRLEELRRYVDRDWHDITELDPRRTRLLAWLVTRGWMERHPDAFLSKVRLTAIGLDVLAQAGGDVTGSGW